MTDFVEQCRLEWRRLSVPDSLAEEMAAELASDLGEAEAEGVSAEEFLGGDARSFAASWAGERGIIPSAPSRGNARRRPLALVAFTALAAIALIVAALLLLTGRPTVAVVASRTTRAHLPTPPPAFFVPPGASRVVLHSKHIRAGRVDPAVFRDRRARLRCMAVVELGPLATTQRLGLATFRDPFGCSPPNHTSKRRRCRLRMGRRALDPFVRCRGPAVRAELPARRRVGNQQRTGGEPAGHAAQSQPMSRQGAFAAPTSYPPGV